MDKEKKEIIKEEYRKERGIWKERRKEKGDDDREEKRGEIGKNERGRKEI